MSQFFGLILALSFALVSCDSSSKKMVDIPKSCVRSADMNTASIIGGQRIFPGDENSKAALLIISTTQDAEGKKSQQICTATPISDRVLITAAHCVEDTIAVTAYFNTDITCENGFNKNQGVSAKNYSIHPNYNANRIHSANPDLALVLLEERIYSGYPIYPIFNQKVASTADFNSDLYLYGYGVIRYEKNDKFKKSSAGILRHTIVDYNKLSIEENSLKIKNNGKQGICSGDSGGSGLILVNGQYQILAINSYGSGPSSDKCAEEGSLILVEPYLEWLNSVKRRWGQ